MKKINLLLVCLWYTLNLSAQDFTDIQTVLPPTPEAASLGKYGEFPVSLYTGQTQLDVPIYTVNSEGLTVPISLSYSTTGIKISEMASRVGLGWTLNAGGVVTRIVKERPDDGMRHIAVGEYDARCDGGFLHGGDNPLIPFGSDQERDVFYFNFAGYSGKFMFENKDKLVFFPHTNLKVDVDWTPAGVSCPNEKITGFYITTPEGIQYSFLETENTFQINGLDYSAFHSSWYLSEIKHPNGSSIQFTYTNLGTLSLPDHVMRMYGKGSGSSSCKCKMDSTSVTHISYNDVKLLSEINFTDGKVVFNGTARQDWPGDQSINQIEVYYKNQKVKEYDLIQSYLTSPGGSGGIYKRLKLDAIKEIGEGTEAIDLYQFNYNQDMVLPHRLSNQIDAWGYYNANNVAGKNTLADSDYLKPKVYFYPDAPNGRNFSIYPREGYTGTEVVFPGADKRSNEQALKVGMLEEITYPTGGKTQFEYELHEFDYQGYPIRGGGLRLKSQTSKPINGEDIRREYAYTKTDGSTSGAVTEIPQFAFFCSRPTNLSLIDNCVDLYLEIDEIYTNPQDPHDSRYALNFNLPELNNEDVVSLELTTSQGTAIFNSASGTIEDPNPQEYVDVVLTMASGCTFNATGIYVSGLSATTNLCDAGQSICPSLSDFPIKRFNLDQNQLGDFCGSPLGYSRVLEVFRDNGYIEYSFNNPELFPDSPPTVTVDEEIPFSPSCVQTIDNLNGLYDCFPFGLGYDQSYRRGLLTDKKTYDEDGNLLANESTKYTFTPVGQIPVDVSTIFIPESIQVTLAKVYIRNQGAINSYIVTPFTNTVNQSGVSYTQTSYYSTFVYSDGYTKYNLSSTSITNSDGQVFTSHYNYANDLNDNLLYNQHIIGVPLETHSPGGVGSKMTYQQVGNRILPHQYFSKYFQPNICNAAMNGIWKLEGTIEEYQGIYPKRISHPCETGEQILTWADNRLQSRQFLDQQWTFQYNLKGLLNKTTDDNEQSLEYFYDNFERLEKTLSRGGAIATDFSYVLGLAAGGENYVVTSTTADVPIPPSINYVDGLGRIYKQVLSGYTYEQNDLEITTSYDQLGRTISQCDPRKGACPAVEYEASPLGRAKMEGATGWPRQIHHQYASENNYFLTSTLDENENTTEVLTDVLGRTYLVRKFLNNNPVETIYSYDNRGNILSITQPNNETFTFSYYPDGKLHTEKVPGKGLVTYEYNDRDLLWRVTDGKGQVTETTYDVYGRIDAVSLVGTGIINDFQYYPYSSAPGQKGKLEYREDMILGTMGSLRHTYTYDNYGRVQTETYQHPLGTDQMVYTYNHRNQLEDVSRTTHEGKSIYRDYVYDHGGRLLSINMNIDGDTEVLSVAEYNERDWMIKDNLGGNAGNYLQEVSYGYNSRGWLKKIGTLGECIDVIAEPDRPKSGDGNLQHEEGGVEVLYNVNDLANHQPTSIAILPVLDGFIDTTWIFTAADSIILPKGSHGMQANFTNTENFTFNGSFDADVLSTMIADKVVNDVTVINNDLSSTDLKSQNYFKKEVFDALKNFTYDENCGSDLLFAEEINYLVTVSSLNDEAQYNGNIASVRWRAMGRAFTANYGFHYDELDRLEAAYYGENDLINNGTWQNADRYNTTYAYDLVGNLSSIQRQGLIDDTGAQPVYGTIDNLTLTYNSGILQSVSEAADPLRGFLGNGSGYSYDGNGNTDQAAGVSSVKHNILNLPEEISLSNGGQLNNFYDASGNKIRVEYTAAPGSGEVSYTQHYISGIEYRDGSIESIAHEKGRYVYLNGTGYHEYSIRDHNGSPRVYFIDVDESGSISLDPADEEVRQEQHYYPFGMSMEGMDWLQPTAPQNRFRYTRQEQADFGWYDYKARWYDPSIGRMMQVDPAATAYGSWSPYNYVLGNPLKYVDPTGMFAEDELNGYTNGFIPDGERGQKMSYKDKNKEDEAERKKENKKMVKAFFKALEKHIGKKGYCCPNNAKEYIPKRKKKKLLLHEMTINPYEAERNDAQENMGIGFATGNVYQEGQFAWGILQIRRATNTLAPLGRGSTGRTVAKTLTEESAMKEALSNPAAGEVILQTTRDARWPGWSKMQYIHVGLDGSKTVIHYVAKFEKGVIKYVDDFRFE